MAKKKFNTVEEVQSWRNFTHKDIEYDLSHLDAHEVLYVDNRKEGEPVTYKFIVTYSFHCFAKDHVGIGEEDREDLMYYAFKESRPFNFERYHLSLQLPGIISSLADPDSLCFHAGYEKFATCKIYDLKAQEVEYQVAFAVFREKKKLRLHIVSAYPLNEALGRVQKVKFLTIAFNTLRGKKTKDPR